MGADLLFGSAYGCPWSDGFLDGPDEGPEAEEGLVFVELAESAEEGFHLMVFHDGEDGLGEAGPGVGAVVGLTGLASASLHVAEGREATTVETCEGVDDFFMMGLVVGYEYRFHVFKTKISDY